MPRAASPPFTISAVLSGNRQLGRPDGCHSLNVSRAQRRKSVGRPDGGQFAPAPRPDDPSLEDGGDDALSLVPDSSRTTKFALSVSGKPRTLIKSPTGEWAYPGSFGHATMRAFITEFSETDDEVADYTALVASDLLNAGDLSPDLPGAIPFVRQGVTKGGVATGLGGAWAKSRRGNLTDQWRCLYGVAHARCVSRICDQMILGEPPSGWAEVTPAHAYWGADAEIGGKHLFVTRDGETPYLGVDGELLHRYAEFSIKGSSPLDVPLEDNRNRREGRGWSIENAWLAAYLLAETPPERQICERAGTYLDSSPHSYDVIKQLLVLLPAARQAHSEAQRGNPYDVGLLRVGSALRATAKRNPEHSKAARILHLMAKSGSAAADALI